MLEQFTAAMAGRVLVLKRNNEKMKLIVEPFLDKPAGLVLDARE